MTVAQFEPLSDEGGIDHTPKTSSPRASGDYMTATPFDLEVYADRYSEMLETRELEYQLSLEDAAEETAFNDWADREAELLEEEDDRHRDQPARPALLDPTPAPRGLGSQIIKLDWPIVRGGGDAA
jgi:hypothetical protein